MKTKLLFTLCIIVGCVLKVKSQSGNNMIFDGASNYITVAKHADFDLSPGEDYTVTCWAKLASLKEQTIFRKRMDSGLGYDINVNTSGVYYVNMRGNPGNVNLGTNAAVASTLGVNQWYHLAMVVNSTNKTLKIYVNGVLNNTSANTTQVGTLDANADVDVLIGYTPVGGGRYFSGQMDDIRVWNKAFTAKELLTDMTTTSVDNTTPNLLAAWDFENVTGNTVPDVSGNGHNGVISGTVTLPVELTSFNAKTYGSTVNLEWETASEKNNDFFEVERSADGKTFSLVSKVGGAINSNTRKSYRTTDYYPLKGINYYRLKQTDLNGTSTHSKAISVEVLTGLSQKLYPNPAQDFIVLNVSKPENLDVEIFDLNGKKYRVSSQIKGNQLIINVSVLNKGVYILKTRSAGKVISAQKFIVK